MGQFKKISKKYQRVFRVDQQISSNEERCRKYPFSPIVRFSLILSSIEAKFGGGVAAYFAFYRWQALIGIIAAVYMVFMYGWHLLYMFITEDPTFKSANGTYTFQSIWGSNVVPFVLTYEAFPENNTMSSIVYITMTYVTILFWAITAVIKIITESKQQVESQVKAKDVQGKKFSKALLNCFDHSIKDKVAATEQLYTIADTFRLLLDEKRREERIKRRTTGEKVTLHLFLSNLI